MYGKLHHFHNLISSDTINIYADQFIRYQDSLNELIICYNNVVIDGNLINGDCDSIFYNKTDSF